MIVVKMIGGLGNQLFQYAFYLSLKMKGSDVKVDLSEYKNYKLHSGYVLKDYFNINIDSAKKNELKSIKTSTSFIFRHLFKGYRKKTHILESNYSQYSKYSHDVYLEGYWQTPKYFKGIEDILYETINFYLEDNRDLEYYSQKIKSSNAVSVHIRGGDYVNNSFYAQLNSEYYIGCIDYLVNKIGNIELFVFTDDQSYAKIIMEGINHRASIVLAYENKKDHHDMYLMSLCQHNIIANSSYSWWGAWLNRKKDKIVIAPRKWYSDENLNKKNDDMIPKDWLRY